MHVLYFYFDKFWIKLIKPYLMKFQYAYLPKYLTLMLNYEFTSWSHLNIETFYHVILNILTMKHMYIVTLSCYILS